MTKPGSKIISIFFLVFLFFLLSTSKDKHDNKIHDYFLEDSTINCVIHVDGGIYLKRGLTKGFHYDLLKEFSNYEKCKSIVKPNFLDDYWSDLINGKTDILVINSQTETIPDEYQSEVISSTPLNESEDVWVVKKDRYDLMLHLNEWFSYYQQSVKYSHLINSYYKRYNYIALSPGGKGGRISPFDNLIKKYALKIGWDWRLVASLIYQESGFDIKAKSRRGAHGLMQIQNSVAEKSGVTDIFDVEQNIKAGTQLLKRLEKMYKAPDIDSINLYKFVLAAYNAGEGRINDLISYAKYKGVNHTQWDSIKEIIPLMKRDEIPRGIIKFGSFKGGETINHVDQVLLRYEEYKGLVRL